MGYNFKLMWLSNWLKLFDFFLLTGCLNLFCVFHLNFTFFNLLNFLRLYGKCSLNLFLTVFQLFYFLSLLNCLKINYLFLSFFLFHHLFLLILISI